MNKTGKYASPTVRILSWERTDVICTSGWMDEEKDNGTDDIIWEGII